MHTFPRMLLAALALAALAGLLAGCESDSVAPHDNLPAVTTDGAANQAAAVAYGISRIGSYALPDPAKATHTFTGEFGLTGTVVVDFGVGSSHLYTEDGAPLVYTSSLGGQTSFDLDLTGTVDAQARTVTLLEGSGGTVTSGEYVLTFTTTGLVLGETYPDGTLTVTTGAHTAVVTFDGTNVATVAVDDAATIWYVNLDTGTVSQAT